MERDPYIEGDAFRVCMNQDKDTYFSSSSSFFFSFFLSMFRSSTRSMRIAFGRKYIFIEGKTKIGINRESGN